MGSRNAYAYAAGLQFGSGYAPVLGQEHCPACWVNRRATVRLRTEPHHSALKVWCVVCDGCGFYVAL